MKIFFSVQEYIVDQHLEEVPVHVADKIVKYHIPIMNPIRIELGIPVYVSQNSGFRPIVWELAMGRDGESEHTFGDGHFDPENWLGAADYTCDALQWLLELLLKSGYKRVCYYPKQKFIHCDFKGDRYLYFEDHGEGWQFIRERDELSSI